MPSYRCIVLLLFLLASVHMTRATNNTQGRATQNLPNNYCQYAMSQVNYISSTTSANYAQALINYCRLVYYEGCTLDHLLSAQEKVVSQLLHSNALCGYETAEVVIYTLVLLLSLTVISANLFEVYIIVSNRNLHSNMNKIVLSLAASDCLLGISFLYSTVLNLLIVRAKLEQDSQQVALYSNIRDNYYLCLLFDGPGLIFASMMASILTLLIIAVEKYFAIFYPFRYPTVMKRRNVVLMIVAVWLVSCLIALLPMFGWHTFKGVCLFVEKMDFGYLVTWAVLGTVSAIVTTFLYMKIWWTAHKQARRIATRNHAFSANTSSSSQPGKSSSSSSSSGVKITQDSATQSSYVSTDSSTKSLTKVFTRASIFQVTAKGFIKPRIHVHSHGNKPTLKALRTIAIILAAFYVFWLPLLCYLLFYSGRYTDLNIYCLAVWAHISGLFNPIVYGLGNKDIRKATKQACCKVCRKKKPNQTDDVNNRKC